MYAVIQDGGRQLRVSEGDRVLLDRKPGLEDGAELRLERVLLIGGAGQTRVGTPLVEGAAVLARVLGERKGEKIVVFKKRKRKNSKCKRGHRQRYTAVRIERIEG
ncbi:MAG: 50S ribosomal protein L21 [Planctomycetota bacterium]|nr:MAG: 50S ribosomal protein L21 [Planctomycetota bacterium]